MSDDMIKPTTPPWPAAVMIVDKTGEMSIYWMHTPDADVLRAQLGPADWTINGNDDEARKGAFDSMQSVVAIRAAHSTKPNLGDPKIQAQLADPKETP